MSEAPCSERRVPVAWRAWWPSTSRRRKFVITTVRGDSRQAPDLVERNFAAEAPPDLLWVADITYIPTWAGFLLSRCRARCVQSPHRTTTNASAVVMLGKGDPVEIAQNYRQLVDGTLVGDDDSRRKQKS